MKARLGLQCSAAFFLLCSALTLLAKPLAAQSAQAAAGASPTSILAVHITGLRNGKGNISLKLKRDANTVEVRTVPIDVRNLTADTVFENLPQGDYSVSFFHDENANGKLDFNFLGIPEEGYGFSNNPPKGFGPPKPELTTFTVNQPKYRIEIKTIYW